MRRAAGAVPLVDHRDDRESQTYSGEGKGARTGYVPQIHPVDDVVKRIHQYGEGHGNGHAHYVLRNAALSEITSVGHLSEAWHQLMLWFENQ